MAALSIQDQLKLIKEMSEESKILDKNIKELQKSIEKETQPGIVNRLEKELEEMNFLLQSTETTIAKTSSALENNLGDAFKVMTKEAQPLSAQIYKMEHALHSMAFAGKQNTDEFKALAQEIGQMKVAVAQADLAVDSIAKNSGIASLGQQFGSLGASVLSLDFNQASSQANNLANNLNSISFKQVTGGIKQMTSAFVNLGKAILANPLFLLVAIIVSLGVAIYKLLDSLGLISIMMAGIKKALQPVIALFKLMQDGLKALTDWMGITAHAAEEKATRIADASAKEADAMRKYNQETQYVHDQELASLKQQDDGSMESLKKQQDIRKAKQQDILKEAQLNAKEAKSEMDRQAAVLANKYGLSAKEIKNGKLTKAQLALLEEDERKAIEESIDAYRLKTIEAGKEMGNLNLLFGDFVNEAKERSAQIQAQDEATRQEAIARAKEYAKNRLEARRAIQDLETAQMAEGIAKEREIIRIARERELQDLLADTTKTQTEKAKLKELLINKFSMQEKELNIKYAKEIDDEVLRLQKERLDKENKQRESNLTTIENWYKSRMDSAQKFHHTEVANEKSRYEQLKKMMEDSITDRVILNIRLQELEREHQEKMASIDAEFRIPEAKDTRFDSAIEAAEKLEAALAKVGGTYANLGSIIIGSSISTAKTMQDSFKKIEEINAMQDVTDEQRQKNKAAKIQAYGAIATAGLDMISTAINAISEAQQQKAEEQISNLNAETTAKIDLLQEQLNRGLISQEQFEAESAKMQEKSKKKEEAIRKKAWEDAKKARVSAAIIDTISGAVSAFTGAMSLGPIAGPIVGGVLAAATLGFGFSNVSKIKSEKYQGGGSSGSVSAPSTPSTSTSSASLAPEIVFRGAGNDLNETTIGGEENQNMNINVNISESEITDTQNQVGKYKNFVTL